jgi:DNA-directed RNA polymerase specialized sigma24 family protein
VHATQSPALDPLLTPFVRAATDAEAHDALSTLFDAHVAPLVRQVVRRHLGRQSGNDADVTDDVAQRTLLRLTRQLWQVRQGQAEAIGGMNAYVAQASANACHEWLRERYPQRARLQQRIRYILRHHASLALWAREGDGWVCGRAEQQTSAQQTSGQQAGTQQAGARVLSAAEVAMWRGRLAVPETARAGSDAARLVALVEAIIDGLGQPARLEDVVTLAVDALGIDDTPIEPRAFDDESTSSPVVETLAAPAPSVDDRLVHAEFLASAWKEIVLLPLRQRTALLLNLTSPDGGDLLSLVPVTGLASWGDIAGLLALPMARMRELAAGLPRDDNAIAGLLGVTRRQVINLRKCARERLARRLGLARGTRREGSR